MVIRIAMWLHNNRPNAGSFQGTDLCQFIVRKMKRLSGKCVPVVDAVLFTELKQTLHVVVKCSNHGKLRDQLNEDGVF